MPTLTNKEYDKPLNKKIKEMQDLVAKTMKQKSYFVLNATLHGEECVMTASCDGINTEQIEKMFGEWIMQAKELRIKQNLPKEWRRE